MDLENSAPLTAGQINAVKAITNGGAEYDDYNPLIAQARNHAFAVCRAYSKSLVDQTLHSKNGKLELAPFKSLFGKLGAGVTIGCGFITEFGFNLYLGDGVIIGQDCKVIDCAEVKIGAGTVIEAGVGIYTASHAEDPVKWANQVCYERPITIGKDCYLGAGCVVTPGAVLDDGVVVMPGSVVVGHLQNPNTGRKSPEFQGCPAKK